jgi:hypothetical protein
MLMPRSRQASTAARTSLGVGKASETFMFDMMDAASLAQSNLLRVSDGPEISSLSQRLPPAIRAPASRGKPPQEFKREHRKRIVAGSHDHDAIATTGQLDQAAAASVTIWKGQGCSTTPFDLANDFSAANAAVDRAAEICRLGHDQDVISVHPVRKAVHQGVLHQARIGRRPDLFDHLVGDGPAV